MNHGLFEELVFLRESDHKYHDKEGNEYVSVSKVLSMLSEPFEYSFAYKNASVEKKQEWEDKRNKAAEHGTKIHKMLESYSLTKTMLIEDPEFGEKHIEGLKSVLDVYKGWRCYDEVCLYSKEHGIAGTADKISAIGNGKNTAVIISDFKTNLKGEITMFNEYGKILYPPFNHLSDCNYVKYSLQLSLYAFMFENLTGRKIRRLFIHFIPPDDFMKHQIIPVHYSKHDVKLLLDTYKPQIDLLLNKTKEEAF